MYIKTDRSTPQRNPPRALTFLRPGRRYHFQGAVGSGLALAEEAGVFEGTYTGAVKDDLGNESELVVRLTHRGGVVNGSVEIRPGTQDFTLEFGRYEACRATWKTSPDECDPENSFDIPSTRVPQGSTTLDTKWWSANRIRRERKNGQCVSTDTNYELRRRVTAQLEGDQLTATMEIQLKGLPLGACAQKNQKTAVLTRS